MRFLLVAVVGVGVWAQGDGTTALHVAVYEDDVEAAGKLVRAGAGVDVVNRYGVRPLLVACGNGNGAMVRLLLEAGAEVQGPGDSKIRSGRN